MKKLSIVLLCLCFVLASSGMAEAYSRSDTGGKGRGYDQSQKCYGDIKLILRNADELGLTEAQEEDIKKQKYEIKKNEIEKQAEIDLVGVDIKKELWKEDVNVNSVNALIDKKYQLKAQRQKDLVGARVAIKNTLTAEQKEKLEAIRKDMKRDKGEVGMRKDKHMMGKKR
jgi:Spy/CpxP family protein refolding chaperone